MADLDFVPVSDGPPERRNRLQSQTSRVADDIGMEQERKLASTWSRDQLEDRYLTAYEENQLLKRHGRKQEEKIKRMATKLLRLIQDKKKAAQDSGSTLPGTLRRDIETEELVQDLQEKCTKLEQQNEQLRDKLSTARQQLITQSSKGPNVQSRIDSNITRSGGTNMRNSLGKSGGATQAQTRVASPPRYGQSVLDEARAENQHLHQVIGQLNEQVRIYEQDIELLKEQIRVKEAEFEEDILRIKQQSTSEHRVAIQENIDFIRVQRELREKATKLQAIQSQYEALNDKLKSMKMAHDHVVNELEKSQRTLRERDSIIMQLEGEIKAVSSLKRQIEAMEEQISDLQKDNVVLKRANEELMASAFDMEREREWRSKEQALKVQIAQLEAALKAEYGEKGHVLDRMQTDNDRLEQIEKEYRELRVQHQTLLEEHEGLRHKVSFFTKDSAIDVTEFEEALVLVKERKFKRDQQGLDFLKVVEDEVSKDASKAYKTLQIEHADTIRELDKTREMLRVQHKINRDYEAEMLAINRKMEENKADFERKIDEYARLLDIRAARIRKLQDQLKDVAYGTRQYRVTGPASDEPALEATLEVELERGENVLEICLQRVTLSQEALRSLDDPEPSILCTWDFYEFETQTTPIMKGARNEYNYSSIYKVKIDDFFLHYLQRDAVLLEVHQATGTEYRTIAAAKISLRDIFEKPHGRLQSSVQLTGTLEGVVGLNFGVIDFWVYLKVPMDHALRLYRERTKALGYISSNLLQREQVGEAIDAAEATRLDESVNNLHVKVVSCSNVEARRAGMQPSIFCVYKFFDYPDHDTIIIPNSNSPQFNDHKTFPVQMLADLDRYLKTQSLKVYAFDDQDPDETSYLGVATIPLISLAHDKPIAGKFELRRKDGTVNGVIEVQMQFQFMYLPPKAATRTPQQILATTPEKPESLVVLMPDEQLPPAGSRRQLEMTVPEPKPAVKPQREAEAMQPIPISELRQPQANVPIQAPAFAAQPAPAPAPAAAATSAPVSQPQTPVAQPRAHAQPIQAEYAAPVPAPIQPQAPPQPQRQPQAQADLDASESFAAAQQQQPVPVAQPAPVQSQPMPLADVGRQRSATEEMSESEGVVIPKNTGAQVRQKTPNADENPNLVVIEVVSLMLAEDARVLKDPSISKMFVEYHFLNVPAEQLETPYALPKPSSADKMMAFNFRQVFDVDYENNYERRQHLAAMLQPGGGEFLTFLVVSEPEDENSDCLEVGLAKVSMIQLLSGGYDYDNKPIPLYDPDDESTEIGTLFVTVKALAALKAVYNEIEK